MLPGPGLPHHRAKDAFDHGGAPWRSDACSDLGSYTRVMPSIERRLFQASQYNEFTYRRAVVEDDGTTVQFEYDLISASNHIPFRETVAFPARLTTVAASKPQQFEYVVKLLWLAIGLSYWKASAAPTIYVEGGLTDSQRHFLRVLIQKGMAEYAYRNRDRSCLSPNIVAHTVPVPENTIEPNISSPSRPLVPIGGGKDSIVTIEALKSDGWRPSGFSVNDHRAIERTASIASVPLLVGHRVISSNLLELNRAGARNGHVPVTAINSLIAILTALATNHDSVVFSNERSASTSNLSWEGIDVNHQWSKSLEFELLLRSQLAGIGCDVEYFSLVRPFSELRIMRNFARHTAFHYTFASCNRAYVKDNRIPNGRWCLNCDKCRFVYLSLAPFLGREGLVRIFGADMFDDLTQIAGFEELLGLTGHRPLECVGEVNECRAALQLVADHPAWERSAVVSKLVESQSAIGGSTDLMAVFMASEDHCIPAPFKGAADAIR